MNGLEITNVDFNRLNGSSNLKAFANVTFNTIMTIKGFKVFKYKSGDGMFATPPSETYQKRDGSTGYSDTVEFPAELREQGNPLMDEIVRWFKEEASAQPTPDGDGDSKRKKIPF
jgi:DNA-binding cell septation regulator SpoVG